VRPVRHIYHKIVDYALLSYYVDSPAKSDDLVSKQFGQDVIDSLSVLEAVVPALHQDLWPKLSEIFPMLKLALQSRYAIVRQSAARCFATVCDVMTSEAMHYVIENVVPLLGDPLVLSNRQGAVELIYRQPSFSMFYAGNSCSLRHRPETRYQSFTIRNFLDNSRLGKGERFG
jgi:TATA-binding protein-associated factor